MNDYPWSRGEPPHEGPVPPPPDRLPFHPIAGTFPMMDKDSVEFLGLVESIKQHGLRERIVILDGKVLDGRNRLRACEEAGVMPKFRDFGTAKDGEPLAFVLAMNLHRRHLTVGQRALLAREMITTQHGGDRTSNNCSQDNDIASKPSKEVLLGERVTIAKAAALWGVSTSSVERAGNVIAKAPPSIVAQVRTGKTELGLADTIANKTPEEQRAHPLVKFAGRRGPRPKPAARPVTVPSLRALTDEQLFATVVRELRRINRAAAREGKQVIITDLPQQKGLAF